MSRIFKINNKEDARLLRQKTQNLSKEEILGADTEKMKKEMAKLLSKEKFGVAIAAPQAGYNKSCFLISAHTFAHAKQEEFDPKKHKSRFFFNPEIIKHSKKKIESDEGCLSVPLKYSYSVPRFEKVTVRYLDEDAKEQTINASGFLARVLQHEFDHLQGVLYTDKAKKVIDVDEELRPINKDGHEK